MAKMDAMFLIIMLEGARKKLINAYRGKVQA